MPIRSASWTAGTRLASPQPHATAPRPPCSRLLQTEPLRSKALTFTSVAGARGVQERSVDTDVLVAEVAPQVLANLQALLAELYIPLVSAQQPARRQAESAKDEFVQVRGGCWCYVGAGPAWVLGFARDCLCMCRLSCGSMLNVDAAEQCLFIRHTGYPALGMFELTQPASAPAPSPRCLPLRPGRHQVCVSAGRGDSYHRRCWQRCGAGPA